MKNVSRLSNCYQWRCTPTTKCAFGQRRNFCASSSEASPLISKVVERRRSTIDDVQRLSESSQVTQKWQDGLNGTSQSNSKQQGYVDLRTMGARVPSNAKPPIRPLSVAVKRTSVPRSSVRRGLGQRGGASIIPTKQQRAKPKRTARGSQQNNSNSRADWAEINALTPAEQIYAKDRAKRHDYQIKWEPDVHMVDSLDRTGPSLPVGQSGVLETVRRRLREIGLNPKADGEVRIYELARILMDGNFVNFTSVHERDNVLGLTQSMSEAMSRKRTEHTGNAVQLRPPTFQNLSENDRSAWEQLLVRGEYNNLVDNNSRGTMRKMLHLIRKNESYTDTEEATFLKKMHSLAPVKRS